MTRINAVVEWAEGADEITESGFATPLRSGISDYIGRHGSQ